MGLGIVFDKFQVILLTQRSDSLGIGATTIQMHDANCLGLGGDALLNSFIVDFQGIKTRLHEHGLQSVFGDGQYRSNIGIGGHNHLVARLHHAHFDISAEDPNQGIQAIGATHGIFRTDIIGIVFFKLLVLFALQVPAAVDHTGDSLLDFLIVQRGDFL